MYLNSQTETLKIQTKVNRDEREVNSGKNELRINFGNRSPWLCVVMRKGVPGVQYIPVELSKSQLLWTVFL